MGKPQLKPSIYWDTHHSWGCNILPVITKKAGGYKGLHQAPGGLRTPSETKSINSPSTTSTKANRKFITWIRDQRAIIHSSLQLVENKIATKENKHENILREYLDLTFTIPSLFPSTRLLLSRWLVTDKYIIIHLLTPCCQIGYVVFAWYYCSPFIKTQEGFVYLTIKSSNKRIWLSLSCQGKKC